MNRDELKATEIYARYASEVCDDFGDVKIDQEYYRKEQADAVMDALEARIKELEDKVQMHDFFWEGCSLSKRGFTNTIDVANYIKELEAQQPK